MASAHQTSGDDSVLGSGKAGAAGSMAQTASKKQSLLGGTIAEKFGGSSKDILEEE